MKIEVLVSTMHQKNSDLINKMNLKTDAIIINQTDNADFKELSINDKKVRMFSFNERGVGLSRNSALMRSDADICVLADDDMVFCDNYEETVRNAFEDNPRADLIIFNLIEDGKSLNRQNTNITKINILNYMNYGAARIAFKRKAISYNGITFNLNFGGGTNHQCGEDTLFLRNCLKKGLNIIALPQAIAELKDERDSTWFKGYNEKYFFDKGAVLALAHPVLAKLFSLYLTLRHNEYTKNGMSKKEVYKEICKGIKFVKKKDYKKV
ncbi:MAG: glycosyltransferase family 2 protein [Clostridia bacterium]|nr:glycosyltransferase family 2 protein [Clostridia bacterium]